MKCASSGAGPMPTPAGSAEGLCTSHLGAAGMDAATDGVRCVCSCGQHVPSHAQLRAARMRQRSAPEPIVTTCGSLRRWQQRSTFRCVRRLRGGGSGNVCNTAPATAATISGTPKQETLW